MLTGTRSRQAYTITEVPDRPTHTKLRGSTAPTGHPTVVFGRSNLKAKVGSSSSSSQAYRMADGWDCQYEKQLQEIMESTPGSYPDAQIEELQV
ncbi:hypothetical protein BDV93DRAFT_228084 [Ceratobasidium sp. AG-I]|nr:hypothetical protein BDV93DRAFT_228084 [Ceratobasidium sp. AG-I]